MFLYLIFDLFEEIYFSVHKHNCARNIVFEKLLKNKIKDAEPLASWDSRKLSYWVF